MTPTIEARHVGVRFGRRTDALTDVSFTIPGGSICGLLGRNGAGKTTLMSVVAAFRRPTTGHVLVNGEDPWENPRVFPEICLIREEGDFERTERVRSVLELAAALRPRWDASLASRLVERFELDRSAKVGELSRGERAALAVTVGLASRAPLTLLDEPHLGMDAAARAVFYDELLTDYLAHPRTIVVSTHLVDEIAPLIEQALIIDDGRVLLHESADDLQSRGTEVIGPADQVVAFTAGKRVSGERRLGSTLSHTIVEPLDDRERRDAAAAGLELAAISLQDLFVHLTAGPSGEHADRPAVDTGADHR